MNNASEPTKLEEGKRYIRRDGSVTGPVKVTTYPWTVDGRTYTDCGQWWIGEAGDHDIVAEYVEPVTAIDPSEGWPPIDPGEGWRLLEPDEIVLPTDQRNYTSLTCTENTWLPAAAAAPAMPGKSVSELRKEKGWESLVFRRRIESPPDTQSRDAAIATALVSRMSDQAQTITSLRQQCERQAETIDTLTKERDDAIEADRDMITAKSETDIGVHAKAAAFDFIATKLDALRPGWRDSAETMIEAITQTINAMAQPLRWERRKPTQEECATRYIVERSKSGTVYGWEPGGQPADEYHPMICILPDILDPEPERNTVTKQRWLVSNDGDWDELWLDCGVHPQGFGEVFKTALTREDVE